jgi:flagellar biosynthesis protein FliR
MNVFMVGMPLKIIIALGGSAILVPAFIGLTNSLTGRMFSDMSNLMKAVGAG